MTIKCKEGKEIIDSKTRQGPDYEAAVQTDEGIGQIVTLIQRTVSTMKECSVDSLENLYTVIAELLMPDDFFRYWTKKTAESKTTPTIDKLVELLQQYRLRLQGSWAEPDLF